MRVLGASGAHGRCNAVADFDLVSEFFFEGAVARGCLGYDYFITALFGGEEVTRK